MSTCPRPELPREPELKGKQRDLWGKHSDGAEKDGKHHWEGQFLKKVLDQGS